MKNIGWIILLLGAGLMLYSLEYYFDFFHYTDEAWMRKKGLPGVEDMFFRKDIDFWLQKRNKVNDPIWSTALYLHIIGSLLPILIGPFQFWDTFRERWMKTHRSLGKIYVFFILGLGVPTGYYMALFANGGLWAVIAFLLLSSLWLGTTLYAYLNARKGAIELHQEWMIRSYAVTFAAVTLRLWTDILPSDFGVSHKDTIVLAAWLAWIPNLIVAESIIRWRAIRAFFQK